MAEAANQGPQGHPHTEMLHVIQRFHRLDLGHMEVEVTFEDPGAYEKPFTAKGVSILLPNERVLSARVRDPS